MLNIHTIPRAFPLDDDVTWNNQGRLSIPNSHLASWLLNTGSLTQRLKSHCEEFRVQVVSQRQRVQNWQVREVILHGNNQPWVLARSVIPQALCEKDFLDLGDKPLGHLIFNDNRFSREPFQLLCMQPTSQFLHAYGLPHMATIWGRRSVFRFQQHAMMVAELFLPQAPAYRENDVEQ